MKFRLKYVGFLFLILMITQSTTAQEKILLNHEKSIKLALTNNPDFKMAEKELSKARAGVWEAYSAILPQVDGSISFQHAWEIQTNTIPNFLKPMMAPLIPILPELADAPDYIELSFGMENTLRYGATLTQPIFLGGAGIAGIQVAKSARDAAEKNLEEKRQSLIYQTTSAFYASLLAKELLNVQEEALNQANANFDIVTKKYNVGTASGFDKMRAEVEVANLKPEVITARNNMQSALTILRNVVGLDRDAIIDIEGKFEYIPDTFGEMTLEEFQKIVFENRPIIQALEDQKRITRKGLTFARSNFLPKVFFQTEYSFMDMRNDYKFAQENFSKGFTSAFSVQIPLFHGFKSTAQYQKARLDYKIMLDTEKQVFDGIATESEVAYNKFQETKQKFLSANQTVDLAKEALRLANLMYEEGANTQLDVLNSQLALTRAKLSYVNSLFEYQMARYQLRKVAGKLTDIL